MKLNIERARPYVAVKRIGTVIDASHYLTWSEAKAAQRLLAGVKLDTNSSEHNFHKDLDEAFKAVVIDNFSVNGSAVLLTEGSSRDSGGYAPSRDRGFIHKSRQFQVSYNNYVIYLSFSFTICMSIAALNGEQSDVSRSKIWVSAIIESEENPIGSKDFTDVSLKIERIENDAYPQLKLIYLDCLRLFRDKIELKNADRAKIEILTLQVNDENFRNGLSRISNEKIKLSSLHSEAFQTLLKVVNENSHNALHFSKEEAHRIVPKSDLAHGLEPFIWLNENGGRAIFVCSWGDGDKPKAVHSKFFGITSSSEPVELSMINHTEQGVFFRATHQPASVMSAALTSEFAARY